MKVEVDGKMYCVETLIADNERLRKDVIASAKTNKLVLDSVRAEIEQYKISNHALITVKTALAIIDKYRNEVNE